jgi:tetratricopeptide (TPR) repeat protein
MLCLMPREDAERACGICGCRDFSPGPGAPPADLALRLIADNRLATAYASLEQLVCSDREDAESARRLAWLAYSFQDFRAVETWCHECERLDDASPEPHVLLGVVLMRAGRWSESVEEFDAALKRGGLPAERRSLIEDLKAGAAANIPEW